MGKGRRVRGVISGFVCGLGIAVLLQQFAIVPLSTVLIVAVPVGMALVGLALGWPRGSTASAEESPKPPDAAPTSDLGKATEVDH
jgi:hypothetical protein